MSQCLRESSLNLANYSEFGLIVGTIATAAGWLSPRWMAVFAIALAVSFLVSPRLTLAYFYVVERGMSGGEALGTAWRDTAPVMWKLALLMLVSILIMLGGVLLFVVGVIPASAIVTLSSGNARSVLAL